jgi:hypothetical protein
MHKVVTERPRHGHANSSRKWGARVNEDYDGPTFVSSARGRQYGWHAKSFSDFLSPLRRFLRSQVGRPWDKVHAEIRKALPNGLHSDHLWSHITSEVMIQCVERDGRVFGRPFYFGGEIEVEGLYVHPRTKLLCYKRKSRFDFERRSSAVDFVRLGENEEYRRIDGIWYYRLFVSLDTTPPTRRLVEKKQLSRRELKELQDEYPAVAPPVPSKPVRIQK